MRDIRLENVASVKLLTPTHPDVVEFKRRIQRRQAEELELKFHERAEERKRLEDIFGVPFQELLDGNRRNEERMLEIFARENLDGYQPPKPPEPSCKACRHSAHDKLNPGALVCWQGWSGGRPKRALEPCNHFTPSSAALPDPPEKRLTWFMESQGISVNGSRWRGHAHDLRREAGVYGFHQGHSYEVRVRDWIRSHYGDAFFRPHRWLRVLDRAKHTHFREVDGLEKQGDQTVYVYEIKQHDSGYEQLVNLYIPLLVMALPTTHFYPIEINKCSPSRFWKPDYEIEFLAHLDERHPSEAYQMFVLPL